MAVLNKFITALATSYTNVTVTEKELDNNYSPFPLLNYESFQSSLHRIIVSQSAIYDFKKEARG